MLHVLMHGGMIKCKVNGGLSHLLQGALEILHILMLFSNLYRRNEEKKKLIELSHNSDKSTNQHQSTVEVASQQCPSTVG